MVPPSGKDWLHEIKHDGYRACVVKRAGATRIYTRRGHDWTARFPAIIAAMAVLPVPDVTIDGEVVIDDANGVSDFFALHAAAAKRGAVDAYLYGFDLLTLGDEDLRERPLIERRAALADLLVEATEGVRLSEADEGTSAETLFEHACAMGLEGIVSKKRDAPYRSGRVLTWHKAKCTKEEAFAVIGADPKRGPVRSLSIARLQNDELVPVGSVGSGIGEAAGRALRARIDAGEPVVVMVEYRGISRDGQLRHPVFRGMPGVEGEEA